ncbi:MAG TPA: glycosyltransferase family 2 protein [Drouetiella sp.]
MEPTKKLLPELSVIVPVYNEEPQNLDLVITRLEQVLSPLLVFYEVVFVDDGSQTRSNEKLRELATKFDYVRLVVLSRNFGELAAICAGLDHAQGSATVNMDSDLQDPPEMIPTMLQYWRDGYDVVFTRQATRKESAFRQFLAFVYYRLLGRYSSVKIPVDAGEFRLLSRRAVNAICAAPEKTKFLRGLVPFVGFKQIVIPFDRYGRTVGESSYTVDKLIKLAVEGLVSFNMQPLYFIPILGVILVLSGLAGLIIFSVYPALIFGFQVTLAMFIVLTTGLQISVTGILAVYLVEVLKEVRGRPTYIVAEKIGWHDNIISKPSPDEVRKVVKSSAHL